MFIIMLENHKIVIAVVLFPYKSYYRKRLTTRSGRIVRLCILLPCCGISDKHKSHEGCKDNLSWTYRRAV